MSTDDLYADPSLYDLEYADQADDVVYYARLAAMAGGPVLELGCGNGRVTLPIARTGTFVHGIDRAPDMLSDLARKVADEPDDVRRRVTWSEGNFCALPDGRRYPLVLLPFNAIHHCTHHQDVLALLAGVRRHLLPGGQLALDLYLPDPTLYARDPEARYEPRDFIDPRSGSRLRSWESGWYDTLRQIHHVRYIYRDATGVERTIGLDLRMFYPQEFRALLDWAGFDVVYEASDFDGAPVVEGALKWVLRVKARP